MISPTDIRMQPAEEVLHRPAPRVFLATLLLSAAIVFLCNLAAGQLLEAFSTNRGYALIQAKWELLQGLERPVDILIVGDSSCNQGINPQVFEEEAHSSAINLCTVGNMIALDDYWMINYYVEKFGAPKKVIIGHVYDSWRRSFSPELVAKTPIVDSISVLNIAPLKLKWQEYARFLLGRHVPLISENRSLAKILMYPREVRRPNLALSALGFFGLRQPDPPNVVRDSESQRKFARKFEFKLSRYNRLALDKIAQLSNTHEFDVYIVNAPMYEGLFEDPAVKTYLAEVEEFFIRYNRENTSIHYLFAEPLLFSDTQMQNADHLILEAANAYTQSIWKTIMALQQSNPDS